MNVTVHRTVEPDFLSVKEVAQLYGVHTDSIYRAIRTGQLAAVRLGGVLRIPKAALSLPLIRPEVADGADHYHD